MRFSKLALFSLVLSVASAIFPAPETADRLEKKIEIKEQWRFRRAGEEKWYPAAVPGCVHTDLLANGLIEDPFFRDNEGTLQWIEERDWEYACRFRVDPAWLTRDNLELVFTGLDTYADVYLNGAELFSARNMFRQWRKRCGSLLKPGENTLSVRFHSPVEMELRKEQRTGVDLPGGRRVWTRKAAYQYGWDWAPRLVTSGIWRPVYLLAWDGARIVDLNIVQSRLTRKKAELTAVFEIESTGRQAARLAITGDEPAGVLCSDTVILKPGRNTAALDFQVQNPRLWWSRGLGEAYLYRFHGRLKTGDGVAEAPRRVGLRHLELVRRSDRVGRSFYFKLNGVPVFMKGANYVPPDSFPSRVAPQRYRSLITSAAEAGMNMLRVWGGGIYENDIFYDLCDEMGILVWQDFMFACAMYPGDPGFLDNVRHEAVDNIKRLRGHPCLALWCGNNEIDEAWHNWGWQKPYSRLQRQKIWRDYRNLFHRLLPETVARYDHGRSYRPSSPRFGRADERSLTEGDSHYWGVWHDGEPFELFPERVGRFMSEYGFQSLPTPETVASFSLPEDRSLDSAVMKAHQKHPRGNRLIQTYLARYFRSPADFDSFIYVSQLLQAEGIKMAVEAHRRRKPYCMGTLYWQLNDCWPAASWSGIDYYGRWKALNYTVKRAFQPVMVSPFTEKDRLKICIVSDQMTAAHGTLKTALLNFSGEEMWGDERPVRIVGNSSTVHFNIPVENLLKGVGREQVVLETVLRIDGKTAGRNLYYFVPPGELDLTAPRIACLVTELASGYSLRLSADNLAKNVYLRVENVKGLFTDNFFDLVPGRSVQVHFKTEHKTPYLRRHLKIVSLIDSFPPAGNNTRK